jgi:chemotaxis protein MotB
MRKFVILALGVLSLSSCIGKKKFNSMKTDYEARVQKAAADLTQCQRANEELTAELRRKGNELEIKEADLAGKNSQIKTLEDQVEYLKNTNTNLLDRMSDLSVVSKTGAESIKKSLEALSEQNRQINDLTSKMQRKDSLNLALVTSLKRSLSDVNDEDVQIEVKKGVVYISLSDKMLFKSGSSDILPRAEEVLGKVAKVLNDYKDIEILVEGHTDNVPIANNCTADNWDLSVKRATSVVRSLQKKYGVSPERMTAGGRSEYVPKGSNATAEGKQLNRRTEIIILPKLDQFFQLLAPNTEAPK